MIRFIKILLLLTFDLSVITEVYGIMLAIIVVLTVSPEGIYWHSLTEQSVMLPGYVYNLFS